MAEGGTLSKFVVRCALCLACGVSAEAAEKWSTLADTVSAENIRRHTVILGGDALEGRAPGSRGGGLAAGYIAGELEKLGVEAFGDDGSYFQQVPLVGSTPLSGSRLTVSAFGEHRTLTLSEDYLLHTTGAQTWLPRPTPAVFVGYGIVAPEFDYSDYADVEVRGKVVVFLAGEPSSDDPGYFAGPEPTVYSAIESKVRIALSRGAVASVLIPAGADEERLRWARLQREYAFEHLGLASSVPSHLAVILHPRVAKTLFAEALFDFDQVLSMKRRQVLRSFHLPVSLSFEGDFRVRSFLAANVIGRIPGSGQRQRDETVVVSAHYDHLGRGPAVDGDSIYNGVVDNAIGSAGLLELARTLMAAPERPRRTITLLFTTAEEEGNLGARFFLDHPPVSLSKIVANINVDGLAFRDPFADVVGIGAELSDLGRHLHRAAELRGLELSRPTELAVGHEAFERSEQAVFAEAGIPAVLVNEGLSWRHHSRDEALEMIVEWFRTRYHAPSDDLDQPLNFSASRDHLAVLTTLILLVADTDLAPKWKPGVPYAYRRLLMLADEERHR
ncbi:MAG: hypothetical protein AMS21_06740 [Gemmatimonas sp. SG8_38_2]|jgi:hypothetical protein|nr:MAG: hypothetical protein AMS21_06740 [Gemmatimonas sp. SG8_38_2]